MPTLSPHKQYGMDGEQLGEDKYKVNSFSLKRLKNKLDCTLRFLISPDLKIPSEKGFGAVFRPAGLQSHTRVVNAVGRNFCGSTTAQLCLWAELQVVCRHYPARQISPHHSFGGGKEKAEHGASDLTKT